VNFTRKAESISVSGLQALSASLFTGPGKTDVIADGNVAVFGPGYTDKFDRNDALKITNSGENFGLKSGDKLLSIEARAPLTASDTLYYHLTQLARRTYQLRFAPVNLQSTGLQAFLVDDFLKTETPVSLSDSSFVDITITSNPASSAANRFMVVFRQMHALPLTITLVSVSQNNHENIIHWNVENENGIQQYEVERSRDGHHFDKIAVVNPSNNGVANYTSTDDDLSSGTFYYRIKSISVDGKIIYSRVLMVKNSLLHAGISVYPNPVKNDLIHLQFSNQPPGVYKITLYNSLGQALLSKEILHTEGDSEHEVNCNNLPKGIYQLQVTNGIDNQVIKIFK
jgi:hypothetical protein